MKTFSKDQIDELLKNPNVSKCSGKAICYSTDFKVNAVKLHKQGISPQSIFIQAGFNLSVIGRQKPKKCLDRWRKIYKAKGEEGLKIETRGKGRGGGRPKKKSLTDTERIKWLEAENAYLKAENDFLAKLRALRAE